MFLLCAFYLIQVILQMFQFVFFNIFKCVHALEHLIPVNQCAIKFRTINAHKLCFASNCQPTGTTHTSAIYHDGIERYICRYVIFLRKKTAKLHHDGRSDSKCLVDMFLLNQFLHAHRYNTFFTIAAIVGHDDCLIRIRSYFIFQYNEIFAPTCQY